MPSPLPGDAAPEAPPTREDLDRAQLTIDGLREQVASLARSCAISASTRTSRPGRGDLHERR